jgi:hypothetical protein
MHYLFYCKNAAHQSTSWADSRPYPEVNTALFKTSAAKAITLMEDANTVMKKITTSSSFSNDLMSAAQQSNQSEVEQLIQSAGIKKKPKITYNPDGITMNFQDFVADKECCHIILQLRWV